MVRELGTTEEVFKDRGRRMAVSYWHRSRILGLRRTIRWEA